MQQVPIYEVWLQSWTGQDVVVFGSLAVTALIILVGWAKRRARPSGAEKGLGLGLGQRSRV